MLWLAGDDDYCRPSTRHPSPIRSANSKSLKEQQQCTNRHHQHQNRSERRAHNHLTSAVIRSPPRLLDSSAVLQQLLVLCLASLLLLFLCATPVADRATYTAALALLNIDCNRALNIMAAPNTAVGQMESQLAPKYGTLIPNRIFVGGIR